MPVIGIVGKPKKGKTVSACTFPKPALLLDYDRGFESVKNSKNKDGSLVVPDWREITVVEFYRKERAKMTFKSFASTSDSAKTAGQTPDYTKGSVKVMNEYELLMDELFEKRTLTMSKEVDGTFLWNPQAIQLHPSINNQTVETLPFQTLIIDPLTSMFRLWKDALLDINKIGDLRRGDYLALEGILGNQFIPNLKALSDFIPYIILIDHEDADTTEKGDVLTEYPVGPSKNLGKNLSEFLDNVWRMDKDSDSTYIWRTKEHGIFRGAGSRWDLPDPIKPATFKALETILKSREVKK